MKNRKAENIPIQNTIRNLNYKVSDKPYYEIEKLKLLRDKILNSGISYQANKSDRTLTSCKLESEKFMKSHFKLHNIFYLRELKDGKISGNDALDPYKLPIEKTDKGFSYVETFWLPFRNVAQQIFFSEIGINENFTEFTPSTISHEITHTQQEPQNGIVDFYTNQEVLPLFIETLHYNENSFPYKEDSKAIAKRLVLLANEISKLESLSITNKNLNDCKETTSYERIILSNKYLESALKALNLFDIYNNSSSNIKQEMLNYIQNIFNANKSLEDFLDYYDVTFESSLDSLQKKFK